MARSSAWGVIGVLLALGLAAWLLLDSRAPTGDDANGGDPATRIAELEAENEFLKHKIEQLEAWRALRADAAPEPAKGPTLTGTAESPEAARRHAARRTGGPDPSLSPELFIQGLRKAFKAGHKQLLQSYRTALFALGKASVPPLLAILRDPREDEALRIEVMSMLQVLQADALSGPVGQILEQSDTSEALRRAALKYLPVKEGMLVPAGVERLAGDRDVDWNTRHAALRILVVGAPESAVPLVRAMLDSRDAQERKRGLQLLQTARSPVFRPMAIELVESPGYKDNIKALLNVLAAMKGKSWATVQMTGPPDTPIAGDLVTAWASRAANMGDVWIELDFEHSVYPDAVRIHETHNAGAVKQVLAKKAGARYEVLWEGEPVAASTPRWFEPDLEVASARTRTIRIILDTNAVSGWNEVDAVELVGGGYRQWAVRARASSSYAGE
jgi:hypothetical protein